MSAKERSFMRPVEERTILITGATDGLGKKVAFDLARQGAVILLHGRSREKGEAVLRELRETTGNEKLKYYNADLASLDEVRKLAAMIKKEHKRLDLLINNAGIGARSRAARRELSAEGYELRFAVNYLSHFLLTRLLLPLIRRSAPARIVNVSSIGQQPLDPDDLMMDYDYDDLKAYRRSKLAQIMFTIDLAEELRNSGVSVNSVHPASLMNTKMALESLYFAAPMSTVEEGAEAVEYLALSPELAGVSGAYFNGKMKSQAHAQAYDQEIRSRLHEASLKLTGLRRRKPAVTARAA